MTLENTSGFVPRQTKAAVMFVDVESFSRISIKKAPEVVFAELRNCLRRMAQIVISHKGVVNKNLGNGLLCYFPSSQNEESEDCLFDVSCAAISAAIQIQRELALQFVNSEMSIHEKENKSLHTLPVRIGIHAGDILMGDLSLSDGLPLDVTLIGETVNIAKRLEGAADVFRILVSPKVKSVLDGSGIALDFGVGALWGRRFLQMKHQTGLFEAWDCNPFGVDPDLLKGALRLVRTGAKRSAPRIPWLCQVPLQATTREGLTGRVVDFSENGFCIEFPTAFGRKEQIHITISSGRDDWNAHLVGKGLSSVTCEVRWIETVGQMNWHGVSFLSFSHETSRALSELLIQFNNRASEEAAADA